MNRAKKQKKIIVQEVESDHQIYEVEAILNKRIKKGIEEYKVKWKGYSEEQATWEPISNLSSCPALILQYQVKKLPAEDFLDIAQSYNNSQQHTQHHDEQKPKKQIKKTLSNSLHKLEQHFMTPQQIEQAGQLQTIISGHSFTFLGKSNKCFKVKFKNYKDTSLVLYQTLLLNQQYKVKVLEYYQSIFNYENK